MDLLLYAVIVCLLTTICNGVSKCKSRIPHGHVPYCINACFYSCDQGYEAAVPYALLECTANNTWIPKRSQWLAEEDLCRAKSCPDISIPNGNISACAGTVDSTCSFSCNPGYKQKSSEIACLPTTKWDHNPHTLCTNEKQCPFGIERGDLDLSCNRQPGEICDYTCHERSMSVYKSKTVTCGTDSTWDKPLDSVCKLIKCPATIPGGVMSSYCVREYKERCDYQCDSGFEKPPYYTSLICNGTAQWELPSYYRYNVTGFCRDKSILCPETIQNATISFDCSRTVGAECSYKCNKHCPVNFRIPLTCQSDLTWSPKKLLCDDCGVGDCSRSFPNGYVQYDCKDNCFYFCDEGYERTLRPSFLKCSTNNTWKPWKAEWMPEIELCKAEPCADLTIPNGHLPSTCKKVVDSTCSYSCNTGYNQKLSQVFCLPSTRNWDQNPHALCTNDRQCPYKIPRGELDPTCTRNPGDICNYTCDEGKLPADTSRSVTCGTNFHSLWDKPLTTLCTDIRCPMTFLHGTISTYCSFDRAYKDYCSSYVCDIGYEKPEYSPTLQCNGSAQWEIPDELNWRRIKPCIAKRCPSLAIPNGHVLECTGYVDSTCSFTCKAGFNETLPRVLCLPTLKWDPNPHTLCTNETQCPFEISNADLSLTCTRTPGEICDYTCPEGTLPFDSSKTISCMANSTWDKRLDEVCRTIKCPSDVPHGRISDLCDRGYDDTCDYYSCALGYKKPKNPPVLRCNGSAQWEIQPHRSHKKAELCKAKHCPNIKIPNGKMGTCPKTVDSNCSYSCKRGFSQKSSQIACLPTQEWDQNPHLLCTNDRQCPFEIPNGELDMLCKRNIQETCSYTCAWGSMPFDKSKTITCLENSTWDKPLDSICTIIQCPKEIPNGKVSSLCSRSYDENCYSYNCNRGFEKVEASPYPPYLRCNELAQWEINWYGEPRASTVCLDPKQMCPETFENGKIEKSCIRTIGNKCEYSCNSFYCPTNTHVKLLACQGDLTWEPRSPCFDCRKVTKCPSVIKGGYISQFCSRNVGSNCHYNCLTGCHRTMTTLYCQYGSWKYGNDACACDTPVSISPYDTENIEDDSTVKVPVVVCIVLAAIVMFLILLGYGYRRKQRRTQRQQDQASPTERVALNGDTIASAPTMDSGGGVDSPPNYNSLNITNETNVLPLIPNAPVDPGDDSIAETALSDTDAQEFPPPPAYNEVLTHPEKYQADIT